MPRALLVPLLIAVIAGMQLPSAAGAADSIGSRIDQLFEAWDSSDTPGAAVAVVRGSEKIYERSFGAANLTYGLPISAETRFNIGSVAKQLASTAILLLEAEGRLALDDSVYQYIPELPQYSRPITIRHLLQHTSGLRDYRSLMFLSGWRSGDIQTNQQAMRLLFRQSALNFPAGTSFGYSNSNYLLAAEIIARVTDTSYADWMHANVFSPLGMHSTQVVDDHTEIVPGLAASYALRGGAEGYIEDNLESSVVGPGNVVTTLNDLLIWADHLMTARLDEDSLLEQLAEQAELSPGAQATGYGLGVYVGMHRGLRVIHHGGGAAGNGAWLMIFPDHDVRIAVLANTSAIGPGRAARSIADIVLGEFLETEPEETREEPEPELSPQDYAGLYALESGVLVEFGFMDEVPHVIVGGTFPVLMHSLGEHGFEADSGDAVIRFLTDSQGAVTGMVLEVSGSEITGSRVPPVGLTRAELEQFVGSYFSEDLETFYHVEVEDASLLIRQLRLADVKLNPVGNDRFREEPGGSMLIEFRRGRRNRIEGFDLSISRARLIRFERE